MSPTLTKPWSVHAVERRSRANGPGTRYVIWFQGCSLGCPGCFNPNTHQPLAKPTTERHTRASTTEITAGTTHTIDGLMTDILAQGDTIDGVTLSGGEPLQQPQAALAIADAVRARSNLSLLIFSGYSIDEIRAQPLGPALLTRIDVLIDGRYQAPQRLGQGLRGSRNQHIHLLSNRYRREDVEATPEAEIRIDASGQIVLTGVNPLKLR